VVGGGIGRMTETTAFGWRRGLQLDVESDSAHVLMDPEDGDENGEWTVYTWASWLAEPPERHADFREFMREMHREFHTLRAHRSDGKPVFVNDTRRKLDALVEETRLDALRGGWERTARALDEAMKYGRPRAAGLGDQIRRLLGQGTARFEGLVTDPRYAPELLPLLVAGHAARSYRDDSALTSSLRGACDDLVALAHATLNQVRNGTYRYSAAGAFGEAVERARELARWGDTDGAWRTLVGALPLWEPPGPDRLAPLGWVADPLLGPLLTPERGRELLSVPRGGQAGKAPGPAAGLGPGDLAWLAEPDPGGNRTSYRFVLVEGVEPDELPGRLTDGDGTVLNTPMTFWEAHHERLNGQRKFSAYDVPVSRAGGSFRARCRRFSHSTMQRRSSCYLLRPLVIEGDCGCPGDGRRGEVRHASCSMWGWRRSGCPRNGPRVRCPRCSPTGRPPTVSGV
jgi:hypothetical protein